MLGICNRQLSRRAKQEETKDCEVKVWQGKRVNVNAVELANGILTRCVVTETADLEQISVRNIKSAKNGKEIQMALQKRELSLCEYRKMFRTNPVDDLRSGKILSAFDAEWFVCEVKTHGKEQGTVTLMEAKIYGSK